MLINASDVAGRISNLAPLERATQALDMTIAITNRAVAAPVARPAWLGMPYFISVPAAAPLVPSACWLAVLRLEVGAGQPRRLALRLTMPDLCSLPFRRTFSNQLLGRLAAADDASLERGGKHGWHGGKRWKEAPRVEPSRQLQLFE